MSEEIRWSARTDVGKARDRNEDSHFGGEHGVFAVADGLGGHNAGDVASRLAIEPISELDRRADEVAPGRFAEALSRAVAAANSAVYERAQADAKVRGMGTTLTAVAIEDSIAHLAHVGDSRCYLIRDGALSQLSADHTLVARMVAEGKLTPEQAEVHPQRSILTRALGAESVVDIDTIEISLVPGDRLLLCSDGLSSVVPEDRILQVLTDSKDLSEGCARLVEEANARGGPDNVTVILLEVSGIPPARGTAEPPVAARASSPAPAPASRAARTRGAPRRVPVRLIVWVLAILVLGLGGWLGVKSWVNRSFFVGVADGNVAIFRGVPADFGGLHLNHVEEYTNIPVSTVPEIYRRNLTEGIRAKSLADARAIVSRVPREGTPSPAPTPTPT